MIDPNQDNIHELLTALGDGELESADAQRVRAYLSNHPELAQWTSDQEKLTEAAERVVKAQSSPAPEALRQRIAQIGRPAATSRRLMIGPLQSLAAVLLLAIGLLIGRYAAHPKTTPGGPAIVPAAVVAQISFVHADCSRLEDVNHSAPFPAGTLSDAVKNDLASDRPVPDLTSIGFRYIGAGPCGRPLQGAVHLLYRATKPGSRSTVSIFVETFDGQFHMDEGKLYALTGSRSPFPILSWRTKTVVYFLVADDEGIEHKAIGLIRGAPGK